MYLTEVGRWEIIEDYPFDRESKIVQNFVQKLFSIHNEAMGYVCHYAALYNDGAFYLFGGERGFDRYSRRVSQNIAKLDLKTFKWSKVGCTEVEN